MLGLGAENAAFNFERKLIPIHPTTEGSDDRGIAIPTSVGPTIAPSWGPYRLVDHDRKRPHHRDAASAVGVPSAILEAAFFREAGLRGPRR